MGSDNLHSRRKERKTKDLKRRKAKRAPYEVILIVCEGEKTEPYYLQELIDHLKLNTANVHIEEKSDSSPCNVVKHAKKLYESAKDKGDRYDRVYCVFDKDTHATYNQALQTIANCKPKNTFHTITSVPCFEYWLLLHFEYTDKPFATKGQKSPADCVIKDLKQHIPEYTKASREIFQSVMDKTSTAITNAERAEKQAIRLQTDNPSTKMHTLVDYLMHIKN